MRLPHRVLDASHPYSTVLIDPFASPLPAIMAVPRPSLRGFLVQAKNALRNAIESSQKVTLVIGNESAGESMLLQPVARALTQIRP